MKYFRVYPQGYEQNKRQEIWWNEMKSVNLRSGKEGTEIIIIIINFHVDEIKERNSRNYRNYPCG